LFIEDPEDAEDPEETKWEEGEIFVRKKIVCGANVTVHGGRLALYPPPVASAQQVARKQQA
jgi:hypothetical protein